MYTVKFIKSIVNKHRTVKTLILCKTLPFIPTQFIAYNFDGIEIALKSIEIITWNEKESAFIVSLKEKEVYTSDQDCNLLIKAYVNSGWIERW